MSKKKNLMNLEEAVSGADLKSAATDQKTAIRESGEKKKKTIQVPVEWDELIKTVHPSTISSYIMVALKEKMQSDGLL